MTTPSSATLASATCRHPHRDGSPCRSRARYRAVFTDGHTLLVCRRHRISIVVADPRGRVRFQNLAGAGVMPA